MKNGIYFSVASLICISFMLASCDETQDSNLDIIQDVANSDVEAPLDGSDISSDADEDIVDADISNSDIKADVESPSDPDLWPDFTNRCATAHPKIQLPAIEGQLVEAPESVSANLKWRVSPTCPSAPNSLEQSSYFGKLALVEINGESTVTVEHGYDWGLGYGIGAITQISADSGTIIECDPFPHNEGFTTASPMLLHPSLDNSPLTAGTILSWDDWEGEGLPSGNYWLHSPDWEDPLQYINAPENSSHLQTKLLPDGQFLLFGRVGYLFSFDSFTGELNWILKRPEIGEYTRFNLDSIAWRPDQNDFVIQSIRNLSDETHPFIAVDSCGNISEISEREFEVAHRIEFGEGYLIPHFNDDSGGVIDSVYLESQDGEQLAKFQNCWNPVSLSTDAIACVRREEDSLNQKLSIIRWGQTPGMEDDIIIENSSTELEKIRFSERLVAFRDSILMTYQHIDYLDENGSLREDSVTRFLFVDWKTGDIVQTIDIPTTMRVVPVVTENGTIIFDQGETHGIKDLFAIETNLHGLSPTEFPRGFSLGRNRNLGVGFPRVEGAP